MSRPSDNETKKPDTAVIAKDVSIPFDDYARALREGAFVSPCGTEGCQWDGFPEPPDDAADDD